MKNLDIIGKKFGMLTILQEDTESKKRGLQVICQCECGNIKSITFSNIKSGGTQSCGCLRKKRITNSLINQRFGKLVVLKDSGKRRSNRGIIWTCQCDCGNICDIAGTNLLQGYTYSCGCLKQSHGEFIIENLLQSNNIEYKKEYIFKDLKTERGGYARFDFAIFEKDQLKYLIEYDGQTHDYSKIAGWNTLDKIVYQQQCDDLKTNYCKNHNIPLIRLSYQQLNNITIKDLILDD